MREIRLLCLAVSRREGGYCVAGIDIDSGEWIRPVKSAKLGALAFSDVSVRVEGTKTTRVMKTLDVVQLSLGECVKTSGQPENWTLVSSRAFKSSFAESVIASGPPASIIARASDNPELLARIWNIVEPAESFGALFGNSDRKLPHQTIEKEGLSHSLLLIRPKELSWARTTKMYNKPRIEARFLFGKRNVFYSLPVTDIEWEAALLNRTKEAQTIDAEESPGLTANSEILLTLSLGDQFPETGYHYKLVAGVLVVPRVRVEPGTA